jgi:Uma2 family endonuclease
MTTNTKMTAEAFLAEWSGGDLHDELIDGAVVYKPQPEFETYAVTAQLMMLLWEYANAVGLSVLGGPGYQLGPHDVWFPDLALHPEPTSGSDQWLTTPPDVAIDFVRGDGRQRVVAEARAKRWHAFGGHDYWLVDPERRQVVTWHIDNPVAQVHEHVVTSPRLPGFFAPLSTFLR